MRLKKIVKRFIFDESNRHRIALGDHARLNPDTNCLELIETVPDKYPTGVHGIARSWVINPNSVKRWLGFDVHLAEGFDEDGELIASALYRLGDGDDEYYFDGDAWVKSDEEWNTENEVSTNIHTFPVKSKKIQLVIAMHTNNANFTPRIQEIRLLYASNVERQEDLIIRSMIPMMRRHIRPIGVYPLVLASDTDKIDLKTDYPLETPYNIVSIDSVFDNDNDPDHFEDLFKSYDDETGIITLQSELPSETTVWINFVWEPEVAFTTDREFTEVEKVPALYVTAIAYKNQTKISTPTEVRDKATGTAVVIPGGLQHDIDLTVNCLTSSARDQFRLADAIRDFFGNHNTLVSFGTSDEHTFYSTMDYNTEQPVTTDGLRSGIFMLRIAKALSFHEQDETAFATSNLVLGGDINATIG